MPATLPALNRSPSRGPARQPEYLPRRERLSGAAFAGILVSIPSHIRKASPWHCDRAHSICHRHSTDFMRNRPTSSRKMLPYLHRFLGGRFQFRHRHRPCTGLRPHGGQAGQAIWRHSCLVAKCSSRTPNTARCGSVIRHFA